MVPVEMEGYPEKVVVTFWDKAAAEAWADLISSAGIRLRPNGSVAVDQGFLDDARDLQDAIDRAWPEGS